MKKPFVSIIAMTYCQEKYVQEMVDSLLSQTYENLEIVISDDCSGDGTWKIIQETIGRCKNVRHKVVLNQNSTNLGFAKHFEKILGLTNGELVVVSGGDDISDSNRVSRIVEEWERDGFRARVICHAARKIDCDGNEVGENCVSDPYYPLGAMMAYGRGVFADFPRISVSGAFEDDVYSYRAMMIGTALVIPDVLMSYRVGSGITSKGALKSVRIKVARGCLRSNLQLRNDLDALEMKERNPKLYAFMDGKLRTHYYHYRNELLMYSSINPIERFMATYRCRPNDKIVRVVGVFLLNLMPLSVASVVRKFASNIGMRK